MTTVRTICTRALRRAGITAQVDTPAAEEASLALALLNDMVYGWAADGVDVLLQADFTLDDTFVFWVPPLDADSDTLEVAAYQSTWNATTNSPSLASSTGTEGHVYRVSVAGSTTLDDVTSWSVDDFAIFTGSEWLKGIGSRRFEGGITAMLTVRLAAEYGTDLAADVARQADAGWRLMTPYYVKPPLASFDRALIDVPSRGFGAATPEDTT